MEKSNAEYMNKDRKLSDDGNNRQQMLGHFWSQVEQEMGQERMVEKLAEMSGDNQRISFFKSFFKWIPPSQSSLDKYKKSSATCRDYHRKVVAACDGGFLKEAERSYLRSLSYAVTEDDFALVRIGNSMWLHESNDVAGALAELEWILSASSCLDESLVDSAKVLSEKFQFAVTHKTNTCETQKKCREERKRRKCFSEQLFRLKSPNPLAPAFEDFVDIKNDSRRGRHVITTKDIPVGTTILVERPFVAILHDTLSLKVDRCHNCFRQNSTFIPCPNCVFALYCDDKCRQEDSSCHQLECPCLGDLAIILNHQSMFGCAYFYQSFKLICGLGPPGLLRIFRQRNSQLFSRGVRRNGEILGRDPTTGVYDPSSYLPIFHLSWGVKRPEAIAPLVALMLTSVLRERTNIFDVCKGDCDCDCDGEFEDFVASLILHHYESFQVNAYSLKDVDKHCHDLSLEVRSSEQPVKLDLEFNVFGRGAFSGASLFNHTCDPNLMRFTDLRFGRTAFVTLRSLKAGDELNSTYGPSFATETRMKRRNELMRNYGFHCECLACRDDWFLSKTRHCCESCADHLSHHEKTKERMTPLLLTKSNKFKCGSCGRVYHRKKDISAVLVDRQKSVKGCRDLVLSNYPLEAMTNVIAAMEYFENNVAPPSRDLWATEAVYSDAVRLIVHLSE